MRHSYPTNLKQESGFQWKSIGWIIVLATFMAGPQLVAQSPGSYMVLDAGLGTVVKHRPTMVFPVERAARSVTLEYLRQTDGSKDWATAMIRPNWGVAFHWQDYGNREVLGYVYAISPYLALPILRLGPATLWGRMDMGFAYHDRIFDRETNPLNNAIGSRINNYTSFGILAEAQVTPDIFVRLGGHFAHQSNARARLPNLGLNTPQWRAGIGYRIQPTPTLPPRSRKEISYDRTWHYYARVGFGRIEQKVNDGPRYPIWVVSAFASRRFRPVQRIMVGVEISHDAALAELIRNQDLPPEANVTATRPAVWAGYELGSDKFGMLGQIFLYLHDKPGSYGKQYWGTRFGPTYYFRGADPNARFTPFVGMYLKTHLFIADYFETSVGIRF